VSLVLVSNCRMPQRDFDEFAGGHISLILGYVSLLTFPNRRAPRLHCTFALSYPRLLLSFSRSVPSVVKSFPATRAIPITGTTPHFPHISLAFPHPLLPRLHRGGAVPHSYAVQPCFGNTRSLHQLALREERIAKSA